jgi:glycosyltransferase involved in cell wall biosynthesis
MLVLASTLAVGGGERVLSRLLVEMHKQGIPVALLCLKGPGPVGQELAAQGLPVSSLGLSGTRSPRALLKLLAALRRQRPAVLYVQDHHDCLFWGRLGAALVGFLPVLSPVHNSAQGSLRAFRLYNRLVLGLSPCLVTLGAWQESALSRREALSPGFWVAIPNPLAPLARKQAAAGESDRGAPLILGSVAALRPEKRQDRLLELIADLSTRRSLELWLIGDGALREALALQAADLGIADRVRFWGQREDVPELLAHLDLFILTSEEEALPLSILEAIRAGVPVAATATGAIPELLAGGRRGLLLAGEDPRAWSRQVEDYLERLPSREELAAWAGEIQARYSLADFTGSYLRLLRYLGLEA